MILFWGRQLVCPTMSWVRTQFFHNTYPTKTPAKFCFMLKISISLKTLLTGPIIYPHSEFLNLFSELFSDLQFLSINKNLIRIELTGRLPLHVPICISMLPSHVWLLTQITALIMQVNLLRLMTICWHIFCL